jgi:RNA recognition motif-containing protein
VNITSGNSLQSFIAARGLVSGINSASNFNQTNNNSNTNPGLAILNQIKQQQQQQQQQQNSAVTSNSNLLASLTPQTSQSLSQCILNNTLFVGNLHASLQEIDLIQVFRPFGRIVECCKKWLHFGFVKFSTEEEACRAYVTLNGFRLKGRPMRLEFQNRTKKVKFKDSLIIILLFFFLLTLGKN